MISLVSGRLLIGHGLRADLKALQLAHPPEAVVDTEALAWGGRLRNLGALCREVIVINLPISNLLTTPRSNLLGDPEAVVDTEALAAGTGTAWAPFAERGSL